MRRFIVPTLIALILGACGGGEAASSSSTEPSAPTVPDGDWDLIDGISVVAGFPITLSIVGSDVSGRAACNSYFGNAAFDGTTATFGEFGATAMACEPEVMAAEAAFLTALGMVETFAVSSDDLTLSTQLGDLVFGRVVPPPTADLVGTTWVLDTLIEGEAASSVGGDPATLLLTADGTLIGSTGCRALTGTWIENGGVFIVPTLSADGECPGDLAKQDSLVVTVVGDEFRADVDGDRLTLTSMGGDGLVYRAQG
jgi:heat shock protein HslJ